MKLFLLKIPDSLHREIKTRAADLEVTMQEYIRELIMESIISTESKGVGIEPTESVRS